ncbi:nucleotidyltransferase domain-containing protein [Larkinella rosea]|uniref:Nucleotidyltransferase domain-containing protein n=1 Tax=Larkinella rosea TaxID=2025312 RepID=A0A3P1BCF4_9BACT|nr:nucleotidyltransferase domain-containing protein [Larkinella rosea]RRA98780.1 nucleotidyltransferase domain-containing protein [Larkinella rosea]
MILPKEKEETLNQIVADLQQTDNVLAIVLGGSYATGKATAISDLDIGIYYADQNPFRIDEIRTIAQKYAVNGQPTVTGFYEWGPWVNGGAWIETASGQVDFLYKNIEQITATVEKAQNGEWEKHFEQQPPYGFSSLIFLAETISCIPLYDPDHIISDLKAAVQSYPPKLKQAVIQQSLWSAEFSIWHADSFCKKKDVYNVMGCLTRAVKNLVDVLFAVNEIYPMGDKRAVEILGNTNQIPPNLSGKVDSILCADKDTMSNNIDGLKRLFDETVALTNGIYQPFYALKAGQ